MTTKAGCGAKAASCVLLADLAVDPHPAPLVGPVGGPPTGHVTDEPGRGSLLFSSQGHFVDDGSDDAV